MCRGASRSASASVSGSGSTSTSSASSATRSSIASTTFSKSIPGRIEARSPGRVRIPRDAEFAVHREQHPADLGGAVHHDHAADVSGPSHEPLADAHHLASTLDVDAVRSGAVLARDLSDPGVDPEPAEAVRHHAGHPVEPVMNPISRRLIGESPGEGDRATMKHSGAPPGQPLDQPRNPPPWLRPPQHRTDGSTTSRRPNATIAPGRCNRIVSPISPAEALSRMACDSAVSMPGYLGEPGADDSIRRGIVAAYGCAEELWAGPRRR